METQVDEKIKDWSAFLSNLNAIQNHSSVDSSLDHASVHGLSYDQSLNDNSDVLDGKAFPSHVDVDVQSSFRPIRGRGRESSNETAVRKDGRIYTELIKSKLSEHDDLDIEILRSDPENPLHSAKMFQEMNLKEPLLRAVAAMGLYKPSTIQEQALSSLIGDDPQNMIAQSQSGTGKTATFLLAMLSRVKIENAFCQCLCMVPTRELALQIVAVGRQLARFMDGIKFGVAVRDHQVSVDANRFVTDQLVVGTPGTVIQWIRGYGSARLDVSKLIVFVLDEADVMLEQEGFLNISKRIKRMLSPKCQILLFSATYDDDVMEFARELVPNPIEIRVRRTQLPLKNIKQYYLLFNDWTNKYQALTDIYGDFDVGQAIIFCATRKEASWLEGRMNMDKHPVILLSGDLDISDRQKVIDQFRQALFRVLITTNVCARGLDVPQVNLVINWNLPVAQDGSADCETYLHRIGRAGRFGKEGLAINFLTAEEKHLLDDLERHFQIAIPPLTDEETCKYSGSFSSSSTFL